MGLLILVLGDKADETSEASTSSDDRGQEVRIDRHTESGGDHDKATPRGRFLEAVNDVIHIFPLEDVGTCQLRLDLGAERRVFAVARVTHCFSELSGGLEDIFRGTVGPTLH